MIDREEQFAQAMQEAERRARTHGRGDVADYLRLRAVNDAARRTGIDWLFATFSQAAGEANRHGAGISTGFEKDFANDTANDAGHRFQVGAATMQGAQMVLRRGVRELVIEAGFPRTPSDGFIRGGGLACANIRHFGNPKANLALMLRREKDAVQWFTTDDEQPLKQTVFTERDALNHVLRFAKD